MSLLERNGSTDREGRSRSGEAAGTGLAEKFARSVFHPSDFSEASGNAFAHALAITLSQKCRLTMMHVMKDDAAGEPWTSFPSVRGTLARWGLLEEGSPRRAVVDRLGIEVGKIGVRGRDVVRPVLKYVRKHRSDLIVLATEGREGLPRWMQPSVAEKLAHASQTMSLFIPAAARGFVRMDSGSISLRRILVPVDRSPDPEAAVARAARAAAMSDGGPVEITLLHVGRAAAMPGVDLPGAREFDWRQTTREGAVVDEIVAMACETSADLVVMATEGRHGVLDALRGSVTDQVLRRAPCPVLAVPASG